MTARCAFVVAVAAAWLCCANPGAALNGRWQPPGIHPATVSLTEVLSAYRRARGEPETRYAQRVERYVLTARDVKLETTMTVRNDDFVARTPIDGAVYEQGRFKGLRWRRTPAGLVRVVESDIQGDDLDRWPLAMLPLCLADCALAGETSGPSPEWVVEFRTRHEYPHWFYIDQKSGSIVREVMREGSRLYTIAFDDFRRVDGVLRPYRWHVSGAGGPLDVAVESIDAGPVSPGAVEIPPSRTDLVTLASSQSAAALPVGFDKAQVHVKVTLNGREMVFLLDSGTSQIIFDAALARRMGIRSTLGHALVREIVAGAARLENANVLTVPLDGFGISGILGYDFFAGHVVHIDYKHERVDLISRSSFVPPATAFTLEAWCGEGLPLIPVPFGETLAERVLLDTGSFDLILLRNLFDRNGIQPKDVGVGRPFGFEDVHFLEGHVATERARLRSIRIGRVTVRDVPVLVEKANAGETIEVPLDGIAGVRLLTLFEWWFDYDGNRLWYQPS